jgi:hypothetical protein
MGGIRRRRRRQLDVGIGNALLLGGVESSVIGRAAWPVYKHFKSRRINGSVVMSLIRAACRPGNRKGRDSDQCERDRNGGKHNLRR